MQCNIDKYYKKCHNLLFFKKKWLLHTAAQAREMMDPVWKKKGMFLKRDNGTA